MIVERFDIDGEHDDVVSAQHIERYKFTCKYVKGKAVLDIACGTGYGTYMLSKAGGKKVIGVDIDEETIKIASEKYREENISFSVGDAQEAIYSAATFDVICSFETIEHLDYPEKHLLSVVKMLKDNGVFICSTPVRQAGKINDNPQNPFHVREWNVAEFKTLLAEYFKEVKMLGQFYHFRQSLIPFNRTVANFLSKRFFKKEYSQLYKTNISKIPRIPPWLGCVPSIQIGMCQNF